MRLETPWRLDKVLQFGTLLCACFLITASVAGLLYHNRVAGFQHPDDFGQILIATLSFHGPILVMIPFFLRQHHVSWREAFGIGPGLKQTFKLAFLVFIAVLPVAITVQIICVKVIEALGGHPTEQAAVTLMSDAKSVSTQVYLAFFAIVVAPVAEEFVFRGVLFPVLRQLGFRRFAWFGVSALFALIHVNLPSFVPLFVLALALTWLYEKTDRLLAPIIMHVLFNTFGVIMVFLQPSGAPPPGQ